ncbi:MAG: hypothetical protein OXG11_01810 [Chloroflexi bacterium]|nr:hypothetical protein [Chloroflexota bacterium]
MRDQEFCFWHHPDHQSEAAEARRLGGLRRRRERTLEGAYDLHERFRSVDGILRFVEIAALDLLGLDASVPRSNAMFRGALVAAKLLELGDLAERIADLEAALAKRSTDAASPFDVERDAGDARSPFHVDPNEADPPPDPALN